MNIGKFRARKRLYASAAASLAADGANASLPIFGSRLDGMFFHPDGANRQGSAWAQQSAPDGFKDLEAVLVSASSEPVAP